MHAVRYSCGIANHGSDSSALCRSKTSHRMGILEPWSVYMEILDMARVGHPLIDSAQKPACWDWTRSWKLAAKSSVVLTTSLGFSLNTRMFT